jgi:hypothetical protein
MPSVLPLLSPGPELGDLVSRPPSGTLLLPSAKMLYSLVAAVLSSPAYASGSTLSLACPKSLWTFGFTI